MKKPRNNVTYVNFQTFLLFSEGTGLRERLRSSNEYKKGTEAGVRGGQEWGLSVYA